MRRTTPLAALAATTLATTLATLAAAVVLPTTPAAAAGTCDGRVATIVVPDAPDAWATAPVAGTPGDDVIVGTDRRDTIDGGGGHDTVCGLAGADVIAGGDGDDRLFGGLDGAYSPDDGYYGDTVAPGPGDDHVDLGHDPQSQDLHSVDRGFWDRVSFAGAAGPVSVDLTAGTATGEGTDTIAPVVHAAGAVGSDHADLLVGTVGPDWVTGLGGDDTILTGDGPDHVEADEGPDDEPGSRPGNDVVDAGAGRDQVTGGWGADLLGGGDGRDSIFVTDGEGARAEGGAGADYVSGNGRTTLVGDGGVDELAPWVAEPTDLLTVVGGPGRDVMRPALALREARRSTVVVGDPTGTVRVGGRTVVRFSSVPVHRDFLLHETTRLVWHGTAGADVLDVDGHSRPVRAFGRGGDDRILGGWQGDLLDGGPGRDRLDGSAGRDRCLHGERLTSCEARR